MAATTYSKQRKQVHLTLHQLELIVNGCRLNKRTAQKELYTNYYGYAMSIVLRHSISNDSAVEMINEAFLKIYKHLITFTSQYYNTVDSFTAWLHKIVDGTCIDHITHCNKKEIANGSRKFISMEREKKTLIF